ncbi:hypothetical protein D3C76_1094570 [compost metagenome]
MHQNTRLTTARPCQHQHIGPRRGNRVTLFVIKAVEKVRNVHWHQNLVIYTILLVIISAW